MFGKSKRKNHQHEPKHKPIILLIIDTLMPTHLEEAVQTGRAPALGFLQQHGMTFPNMVSSFPTMSVTIDSTLLTGTYPDEHRIPGLTWFDQRGQQIINYGTGFREVFKTGLSKAMHNHLYRLNNEHLSRNVTTLHEHFAHYDQSTASINGLVYRGNTPHHLKLPTLLTCLTSAREEWTSATPPIFSLGALSKLNPYSFVPKMFIGSNKHAARELKYMIRKQQLPSLTICYFQDMDLRIHFQGPLDVKGVMKADQQLQQILYTFGSWQQAIEQCTWIVMGDNGQASMGFDPRKFGIDLRKQLKPYRVAKINKPIHNKDDVALCVNQRMAYIYPLHNHVTLQQLAVLLQRDRRIDVIAWKDFSGIEVISGEKQGELHFYPSHEGTYKDEYDQKWIIKGDLHVLDLSLAENGYLSYGDYPDALARLHAALHSHLGPYLIANAKPGCEFSAESTPLHMGGAAHGGLHKQDSLVPMIVCGTDSKPDHERIVDLKEWIMHMNA